MIQQLQHTDQPLPRPTHRGPAAGAPATPAVPPRPLPPVTEGNLEGTWTAQPAPDTTITVTFHRNGHFTWKVARQGKDQQFSGTSSYENGILTLVQDQNNNTMVGNMIWKDETHFTFKVHRRRAHRSGPFVHQGVVMIAVALHGVTIAAYESTDRAAVEPIRVDLVS